ncbi:MAG: hypothetical protein SFW36_04975 [Leptolyngbyaceae cyanobacterium bins.59]|nr:hypothetical protein [Leptolyngbyaceae cyanobacterium bins.59]
MKSWLLSIFVSLLLLLNFAIPNVSQALADEVLPEVVQVEPASSAIDAPATVAASPVDDRMQQLNATVLPQMAEILSPEQCDQVVAEIKAGKSFRKAFKGLALTPDQKYQLANILKALPQKDMLASLTPEQKKQFFLKKKEGFMPTPEEISEKISAGMKMKTQFAPEGVSPSMKEKGKFVPTPEEIAKKISDGRAKAKAKLESATTAEE